MKEQHCYVAVNYLEELDAYASPSSSNAKTHVIQLPFTNQPVTELTDEEKQKKHQMRVEQGLRLKEMAQKRRQEKLAEKEEYLSQLKQLKQLKASNPSQFKVQSLYITDNMFIRSL
jgi:actin-related protein 5